MFWMLFSIHSFFSVYVPKSFDLLSLNTECMYLFDSEVILCWRNLRNAYTRVTVWQISIDERKKEKKFVDATNTNFYSYHSMHFVWIEPDWWDRLDKCRMLYAIKRTYQITANRPLQMVVCRHHTKWGRMLRILCDERWLLGVNQRNWGTVWRRIWMNFLQSNVHPIAYKTCYIKK